MKSFNYSVDYSFICSIYLLYKFYSILLVCFLFCLIVCLVNLSLCVWKHNLGTYIINQTNTHYFILSFVLCYYYFFDFVVFCVKNIMFLFFLFLRLSDSIYRFLQWICALVCVINDIKEQLCYFVCWLVRSLAVAIWDFKSSLTTWKTTHLLCFFCYCAFDKHHNFCCSSVSNSVILPHVSKHYHRLNCTFYFSISLTFLVNSICLL